jgi:hypothetical protein
MATITFRCSACQQVLKIGADKAGKKAKCLKCGTPLTVPAAVEEAIAPVGAAAPAPKPVDDDDDEGGAMTYTLKEEEARSEQKEEKKITGPEGPGRRIGKRQALIKDGRQWRKTAFGMQIIAGGLCVWLAAFLLAKLPVLVGVIAGPEYAASADERLVSAPANTKDLDLDLPLYGMGLISSNGAAMAMLWIVRIAQVLFLFMYFGLVTGYVVCLTVPDRFGTKLQVMVLIGLAGANAFFGLLFKLLPMLGLWEWTVMPLVAPEVAMIEMNQERMESLLNFWSPVPALDVMIAIVVVFLQYFETVMIAVFIRACGLSMRVDEVEKAGFSLIQLGLGQCFIQLAWLMCANCGTSIVLLVVLRVVYMLGVGFFVGQLIWTIVVLFSMPGVVEKQLGDEALLEDEEEEPEEEEEEEPAKKAVDEDEDVEEMDEEEVVKARGAAEEVEEVEEQKVEEVEEEKVEEVEEEVEEVAETRPRKKKPVEEEEVEEVEEE